MDALTSLLAKSEGKTLEFKRDLSSPEKLLRSLVAFANTAGGTVLVGVEDKTRRVVGIADVLDVEERIASLVADSIVPRLLVDIEIHPWRAGHVISITVHPGSFLPFHLKKAGPDEGVLIRIGSTNRRADPETIAGLKRFGASETFDEQAVPDLDSEAIDFRVASECFAPLRTLRRRDLRTLRMTTSTQGKEVPTIGGLLLFGRDRLRRFPDACVAVGRFEGTTRDRILDTRRLEAVPVRAVSEAIEFVEKHLSRELVIGRLRRSEAWTIPPVAVREAIVNAVVHADYSLRGTPIRVAVFDDRVEIASPGLLPVGLTVEDLRQGVSKVRNRVIARVFQELGLVEQWGSGVPRMLSACRDAGLAEPELDEIGTQFRVILRAATVGARPGDDTDRRILSLLIGGEGMTTSLIAESMKLSTRAVRTRLGRLVKRGLIAEVGSGPHDPRRRYVAIASRFAE